jgi:hypothetical protein
MLRVASAVGDCTVCASYENQLERDPAIEVLVLSIVWQAVQSALRRLERISVGRCWVVMHAVTTADCVAVRCRTALAQRCSSWPDGRPPCLRVPPRYRQRLWPQRNCFTRFLDSPPCRAARCAANSRCCTGANSSRLFTVCSRTGPHELPSAAGGDCRSTGRGGGCARRCHR